MSIGPVAQWIRHRPTEPGIAGSSPAGVILLPVQLLSFHGHASKTLLATPAPIICTSRHLTFCVLDVSFSGPSTSPVAADTRGDLGALRRRHSEPTVAFWAEVPAIQVQMSATAQHQRPPPTVYLFARLLRVVAHRPPCRNFT